MLNHPISTSESTTKLMEMQSVLINNHILTLSLAFY